MGDLGHGVQAFEPYENPITGGLVEQDPLGVDFRRANILRDRELRAAEGRDIEGVGAGNLSSLIKTGTNDYSIYDPVERTPGGGVPHGFDSIGRGRLASNTLNPGMTREDQMGFELRNSLGTPYDRDEHGSVQEYLRDIPHPWAFTAGGPEVDVMGGGDGGVGLGGGPGAGALRPGAFHGPGGGGHTTFGGMASDVGGFGLGLLMSALGLGGLREGGIVGAMPPGARAAMNEMPPDTGFAEEAEIVGPGGPEFIEESAIQVPGLGEDSEMMVVFSEARDAIEGNHPNPEEAIRRFEEMFGPEALQQLIAMVTGAAGEEGMVDSLAGGDGMSDSIPGNIDGLENVALSEGEYVVPADAVSHIGNGSTEAGGRRLQEMIAEIRNARTGNPGSPNQIDPRSILA